MSGGYRIETFEHRPHVIPEATETSDGVMSSEDKLKLDGISPGGAVVPTVRWVFGQPYSAIAPLVQASKPCNIVFDPGAAVLGGFVDYHVDAGAWDLREVVFDADLFPSDSFASLVFDAGATLSFPYLSIKNLFCAVDHNLYTGPVVNVRATLVAADGAFFERLTGAYDVFHLTGAAGGMAIVGDLGGAVFNDDGTGAIARVNSDVVCNSLLGSDLHGLMAVGDVPVNGRLNFDDLSGVDPVATIFGVNVTPIVNILALSSQSSYTPAAGNFANPQPTEVANALDRIAALVKTLNGGVPIP